MCKYRNWILLGPWASSHRYAQKSTISGTQKSSIFAESVGIRPTIL